MNRRESFKVYKVFDNKIDIIFSRVALLFFVRFLIKILIDLGEKNEIEVIELQHSLSCISKTILVRSQSKYPSDRILHSAWDMQVSFITCTHIGLE